DGASTGIFADNLGGSGGAILLESKSVTVSGGAVISSRNLGFGNGGSVTIRGAGTVSVAGNGRGGHPRAIFAGSEFVDALGKGGDILLEARDVTVSGGALISSSAGVGNGGTVRLLGAHNVALSGEGSGIFAASTSSGNGGEVDLFSTNVTVAGGAQISSS